MLRKPVQGPRDQLPRRPWLRPLQGLPVGGRDEDGARRPRRQRRDLHARHRVGLPRRGVRHRRLGAGRERGAGHRRPRRVLRLQAHAAPGPPQRAAPQARGQGDPHGLRADGRPRHHAQRAHAARGPRTLLPHGRAGARAGRRGAGDRGPLQPPRRPAYAHGRRVGAGRRRRPPVHRAGAARDGQLAARAGHRRRSAAGRARPRAHRRARGRRRHRQRARARRQRRRAPGGVPARRGAGGRHHDARLGHGDEVGRRRRHQPWRAHLPRGHRRPRARHSRPWWAASTRPRRCAPATR